MTNLDTATSTTDPTTSRLALVTGATGYVGGQVAQRLVEDGWRVRVLSRSAKKVKTLPWWDERQCEAVEGNANSADDLRTALADVDVAWYLLHSMGDKDDFMAAERDMAQTFADVAKEQGVSRLVYLGGLHPDADDLSEHLKSRVEVGEILMNSGVPTAALQAGVVIGDESASFIMLRTLSERLPGAVAPSWINNNIQPIAVADAVHYLVAAARLPADVNRTFDIGGPEPMSYVDMMREYAKAVGLPRRLVASAPIMTPKMAAHGIGLVTPITTEMAEPLIGSLQHDTVVKERDLDDLVGPPPGGHHSFADAVRAATRDIDTRKWRRVVGLTSAAVATTAAVGSLATNPKSVWYRTLKKPSFQPPAAIFPVAWSALYVDIALVAALSMADLDETERRAELKQYIAALGGNLLLNAGWSVLFFNRKKLTAASVESVMLAASSADLVRRSWKVSPEKGVALTPYAAWTTFASALTWALRRKNPRR